MLPGVLKAGEVISISLSVFWPRANTFILFSSHIMKAVVDLPRHRNAATPCQCQDSKHPGRFQICPGCRACVCSNFSRQTSEMNLLK